MCSRCFLDSMSERDSPATTPASQRGLWSRSMASIAVSLVFVGGFALGWMLRPELGFHGATGRCKEAFVRRLALGLTLAVAAVVAP